MPEQLTPRHRGESITQYGGPWVALDLFTDPLLSIEQCREVLSVTKKELFSRLDTIEQSEIDLYLLSIAFMDEALKVPVPVAMTFPKQRESAVNRPADSVITGRIAMNIIGMPKDLARR